MNNIDFQFTGDSVGWQPSAKENIEQGNRIHERARFATMTVAATVDNKIDYNALAERRCGYVYCI